MKTWLPLLAAISIVSVTPSCQKNSQVSESKHEIGSLPRKAFSDFEPCTRKENRGDRYKIQVFLYKIFDRITSRNPEIFKGKYAPENFCIYVVEKDTFNASAISRTGSIEFNTGLIDRVSSSLEVAFVMAHELSHVLAQHNKDLVHEKVEYDPRMKEFRDKNAINKDAQRAVFQEILELRLSFFDDLAQFILFHEDALWQKLEMSREVEKDLVKILNYLESHPKTPDASSYEFIYKNVRWEYTKSLYEDNYDLFEGFSGDKLYEAFKSQYQVASIEIDKKFDRINQLSREYTELLNETVAVTQEILGGHEGAILNWMEEEADDLALELMLRAGLEPFKANFQNFNDYSRKCQREVEKGIEPERGLADHPKTCWRVYNLLVQEPEAHKEEYDALIAKGLDSEFLDKELRKLKKPWWYPF